MHADLPPGAVGFPVRDKESCFGKLLGTGLDSPFMLIANCAVSCQGVVNAWKVGL